MQCCLARHDAEFGDTLSRPPPRALWYQQTARCCRSGNPNTRIAPCLMSATPRTTPIRSPDQLTRPTHGRQPLLIVRPALIRRPVNKRAGLSCAAFPDSCAAAIPYAASRNAFSGGIPQATTARSETDAPALPDRGVSRSPDQLKHLIFNPRPPSNLFFHPDERVEPVAIDQPLTGGKRPPIAGGVDVIHTPGHCSGQVALLWRPGRMLFTGDVCMNIMGLGDPVGFESLKEVVRASANLPVFRSMSPGSWRSISQMLQPRFRNKWGKKSSA